MAKAYVASNFPRPHKKFSPLVWHIIACLTNNSTFPKLPVTIQDLTDEATAYDEAAAAADKKTKGAAQDRDGKRADLEGNLHLVEAYVQRVISKLPPDAAPAAILSSGFGQKKDAARSKDPYAVKRTKKQNQGDVTLDVKSLGRHGTVMYCHQYSLNNGQTWVDCIPTDTTKLVITGLPVGTTVSFRFRTLIKRVYGDWSQTLTYPVH